jgi:hypothetical protein
MTSIYSSPGRQISQVTKAAGYSFYHAAYVDTTVVRQKRSNSTRVLEPRIPARGEATAAQRNVAAIIQASRKIWLYTHVTCILVMVMKPTRTDGMPVVHTGMFCSLTAI